MNILEEMASAYDREAYRLPSETQAQEIARMSAAVMVLRKRLMINELGLEAIKEAEKEMQR